MIRTGPRNAFVKPGRRPHPALLAWSLSLVAGKPGVNSRRNIPVTVSSPPWPINARGDKGMDTFPTRLPEGRCRAYDKFV